MLFILHLSQKISDVNIVGHLMRPKILTSEIFCHFFVTRKNIARHFLCLNSELLGLKCVFSCLQVFYIFTLLYKKPTSRT